MANEFVIKNGFHSQGDSQVTGSVSINSTSSPQVTLKNPGGGSEGMSSIAGGTLASFSPSTYDYIFGPITANPATVTLQFSGNDVFYGNITSGYIPQKNPIGFGNSPIYIDGLNNIGIGTSSPSAKFQVKGSGTSSSTLTFLSTDNNDTPSLFIQDDGNVGINRNPFAPLDIAWWDLHVSGTVASNNYVIGDSMYVNTNVNPVLFPPGYPMLFKFTGSEAGYANVDFQIQGNPVLSPFGLQIGWSPLFTVKYDGKVGIGINNTQPSAQLQVKGVGTTNATEALRITDSNDTSLFKVFDNGDIILTGSLNISGSININNVLTLTPQDPLPTGAPTGSFAVSSSTPPKPYFWDGSTWNALY